MLMWTEGQGADEHFQFVSVSDTPEGRQFLFDNVRPDSGIGGGDVNWDTVMLYREAQDELPADIAALIESPPENE